MEMAGVVVVSRGCRGEEGGLRKRSKGEEEIRERQLSVLALLLGAIRRSVVACRAEERPREEEASPAPALAHMEIGWPTDVEHVAHVTFDRFHGFLGLPVEFEVEIPCRVPSASARVFGVSAESMQCCFDSKGNSVPIILLLMQDRLYSQGGLKAEGIFRINPENSKEEEVREQLNQGIVPEDIEVHCLAGLIKAWFRELPEGVLDGLSPEQVLQCNSEDQCLELVQLLRPTQAALLNWAVELMADVVEEEELNKMNARNIAMVFAPNMTQMSDPLTALMHAVQVMNLLKALIVKALREREEAAMAEGLFPSFSYSPSSMGCTDEEMSSDDARGIITSEDEYESDSASRIDDYDENADNGSEKVCLDDLDDTSDLTTQETDCQQSSSVDGEVSCRDIILIKPSLKQIADDDSV
ncbi:hypothetical protein AXF42_Ash001440 [Apostasia shenzhenica]|uniref:Rho GTPase-activating protein 2 n=1 Tax=Apostasia shenzhenica TaxID=1088818 RepID=A0A2I0AV16_9ASPA|nr:hypothetical protein AXF42_Ash001440 [Apostasia shenzhenica]